MHCVELFHPKNSKMFKVGSVSNFYALTKLSSEQNIFTCLHEEK